MSPLSRRQLLAGLGVGAAAAAIPGVAVARKPPGPPGKPGKALTKAFTDGVGLRDYSIVVGPASARTVLFEDSFAAGNFFKWGQLQWSTSGVIRNGNGTDYSGTGEYSCQVVSESAGHTTAARFELRNGDIPFGGTERTEIAEPGPDQANLYPTEGDEFWIEFDLKFDSAWPVPVATSGWCVIWQWHDLTIGGSPPLCLDIDTDDVIYLANNDASGYQRTAIQAVQRNVWQHWKIHAKFSSNPAIGFAEVIVDDVVKVAQESRRTIIPGDTGNYFKMGIYRDPDNTATGILYYDNFSISN